LKGSVEFLLFEQSGLLLTDETPLAVLICDCRSHWDGMEASFEDQKSDFDVRLLSLFHHLKGLSFERRDNSMKSLKKKIKK
jgi:hypothetical protein